MQGPEFFGKRRQATGITTQFCITPFGHNDAFVGFSKIEKQAMTTHVSGPAPQGLGILCAVVASLAGLAYLAIAQAPMTMIGVNLAALVLGITVLFGVRSIEAKAGFILSLMMVMAVMLLATALLGAGSEGARRWVTIGPLVIQSSLVLLPALILLFVRYRNGLSTLAMAIAAVSLALQPDRAMAGTLLAALIMLAFVRPDRFVLAALLASAIAFAVTLFRPDNLPAVPFVDQVYYTAFDLHWFAGSVVLGGTALLLLPAVAMKWSTGIDRTQCIVFGAIWLGVISAAALGNYPTPVVGYSGAAILGYALSLAVLPRRASGTQANRSALHRAARRSNENEDGHARFQALR